ncbi:heterokaryon incompatibility protein-domain-containing protein, partial [Podospora conica]
MPLRACPYVPQLPRSAPPCHQPLSSPNPLVAAPSPRSPTPTSSPALRPMATAYQYSKLPPDSIRLLRLLPHRNPAAPIRCTLFDCPLLQSHDEITISPYEALSYVWGSTDNPQSAGSLSVTRNLHEALVQLRDRFIDRVLWVDAICINQDDLDERSCQVASMARIYAMASRVLVWLGPAGDDGAAEALRKCLDYIRHRRHSDEEDTPWHQHRRGSSYPIVPEEEGYSWIFPIFQRPWFQRIWVLQEVAAARHILILCGSIVVDGLALCACVDALGAKGGIQDLEMWIKVKSGLELMKDTFQSNWYAGESQQFNLAIAPLADLLDVYLPRQASDVRDKVYALLGMCSDDFCNTGLVIPDYSRTLVDFFSLVCKHVFSVVPISVKTWGARHVAGMRTRGRVLGRVYSIQDDELEERLGTWILDVEFTVKGWWSPKSRTKCKGVWRVRTQTVRPGDIFVVLPGARWPMIGRIVDDHLLVVACTATFEGMDHMCRQGPDDSFWSSDLWLLWDW